MTEGLSRLLLLGVLFVMVMVPFVIGFFCVRSGWPLITVWAILFLNVALVGKFLSDQKVVNHGK